MRPAKYRDAVAVLEDDARGSHPDAVVERAVAYAEDHPRLGTGVLPAGIAAACLYRAYREDASLPKYRQADAGEEMNVTAVTIRERLREMGVEEL